MLPQLILLGLLFMSLGIGLAKHGEPRSPYSFWDNLISFIIMVGLLIWGGFFRGMF